MSMSCYEIRSRGITLAFGQKIGLRNFLLGNECLSKPLSLPTRSHEEPKNWCLLVLNLYTSGRICGKNSTS